MAQHADIAVCAHVSCWAILRHYSERHAQYAELPLHDITRLAQLYDPGGLTPSLGLYEFETERIFHAAGCYPLTVVREFPGDADFYAQMLSYLESGFPLYVALESKPMGNEAHAIVVAGLSWRDEFKGPKEGAPRAWSLVDSLLAVDDNLFPYCSVGIDHAKPGIDIEHYTVEDFDTFIVPLPEKIYYSARAIETFSLSPLYRSLGAVLNLHEEDNLLRRYFITTVSALRRYARKNRLQLGKELTNLYMHLRTTQFVWVLEYTSEEQWRDGKIAARAVLDASASPMDKQPVWMCHNLEIALVLNRGSELQRSRVVQLGRPTGAPLNRMDTNLHPAGR